MALIIYRASIVGARPVYQRRSLRLIGEDEKALPELVEIRFRGQTVDRLTKNYIVFWNSGRALLRGSDIVREDPLRCEFSEGSRILDARVVKTSRLANKFLIELPPEIPHRMTIAFDYLDPGDGAVVEILHTDSERYPKITGTIKGVPKGCLDWGRIRPANSGLPTPFNRPRRILFGAAIIGLAFFFSGVLMPESVLKSQEPASALFVRRALVVAGALYATVPVVMLWLTRRRFPRNLSVQELDE